MMFSSSSRARRGMAGVAALAATACVGLSATPDASASERIIYEETVTFRSDLQDPKALLLPSFNEVLGTLDGVIVEVYHSGSMQAAADNDDPLQGADCEARLIREWTVTGPDVNGGAEILVASEPVFLAADDGDLQNFDSSAPDGFVFGELRYDDLLVDTFFPNPAFYQNDFVSFEVTPTFMGNDLQFVPVPPDAWQLEVQKPRLEVTVRVIYDFTPDCDLTLDYQGECPSAAFRATCGTPGGEGWVFFAYNTGDAPIPSGPCAGVITGLGASLRQVGVFDFDNEGNWTLETRLKQCACEGFLQILDVDTCRLSNVVQLN